MKGYTIDCQYLIRMREVMKKHYLPLPHRKTILKLDDETLPLILLEAPI